MDITFIAGHLDHNGAGSNISLDILAKTLSEWGHTVRIVTLNVSAENTLLWDTPYDVTPLSSLKSGSISDISDIVSVMKTVGTETDLFHVFDPIFSPILALYRRLGGGAPVVVRLNSYTLFCTNDALMDGECHKNCTLADKVRHDEASPLTQALKLPQYLVSSRYEAGLLGDIDHYFAQSPSVKRIYTEAGFDADKITTITNFYDPEFADRTVEDCDFERQEFNFLYVGRLTDIKAVDVLVEAVDTAETTVSVDIVGDGSAKSALEAMVDRRGLRDQITFHGWVNHDDLPAYYSASDIFVHPGRWEEPSGRALLEAMQYHCPAIVSDIGGPPWIIGDAGLTFEPDNPDELAAQLDAVVRDESLRTELQTECEHRLEAFDPEALISKIESQYATLTA